MRYSLLCLLIFLFSCDGNKNILKSESITWAEFYESDLFRQVQMDAVFPDSKTFTDYIPNKSLAEILAAYEDEKSFEGFNLKNFVDQNFDPPAQQMSGFTSDTSRQLAGHIEALWPFLTREPDDPDSRSSLIPLPHRYVVPGGRFREIYYWDSYFTMQGLRVSEENDLIEDMVRNFAWLIDTVGFIPNGNRAYYRGRSQPPFFAGMVDLLAGKNRDLYLEFLPALEKEYSFWMDGSEQLDESERSHRRVVLMEDGEILNRYWDDYALPRPESYKEDVLLARGSSDSVQMYRDLRAGAESGWDFSSRWFSDGKSIETIHTTEIIPVDLNTLLYFLEIKLAQGYDWQGKTSRAQELIQRANARYDAIHKYLWNEELGFFVDFDWVAGEHTPVLSLAGVFPLFYKIATKNQAARVAKRLESEFLMDGGFVTTLNQTGQQWDAPNGWAPLQWTTINGLYNYSFHALGNDAAERWLERNREVYLATGKMMEKYNVVDISLLAGGGEYALQDGFGWTNGVALAIERIFEERDMIEEMRK